MSEIQALKERKKVQTKRLKTKLRQKSNLSSVNDNLLEKLLKVNSQLQESKDAYIESRNHAIGDTDEAIQRLEMLGHSIYKALEIHNETNLQGKDLFPSRVAADGYFQAEEEFTASLTGFTKRQFFEGIADMAGSKDKLRYEMLEVSKPEIFLIRGESEEVLQSKCKELQRLQSVYSNSQMEKFENLCKLHRIQACLYKSEESISKISVEPVTLDADNLNSKIANLQSKCEEKSQHLQKIFETELAPLIEEMSEMQTAKILSGNYDLKIARQDYFISKQEEVIDQLLLQNSRYEFLSILYEMEAKSHRDTYHLLSSAKSILSKDESAMQTRLAAMSQHLQAKQSRETIDSRDYFMQNLFKAFETEDHDTEKRLFITYDMLQNNFQKFFRKCQNSNDKSKPADNDVIDILDKVKQQLDTCTSLVLGTRSGITPDESQENLSDGIAKIEDVVATIEKSVKSAISEIDKKKRILASDSMKALQRSLFTTFFNDPARMKRIISELRTRVEAVTR